MKRLIKIAALLLVVPALGRSQDLNEQPRTLAHVFAGFATHRMALNAGFGAEFGLYKGLAVGPEFAAAGIGGRANSDPASNPNIWARSTPPITFTTRRRGADWRRLWPVVTPPSSARIRARRREASSTATTSEVASISSPRSTSGCASTSVTTGTADGFCGRRSLPTAEPTR